MCSGQIKATARVCAAVPIVLGASQGPIFWARKAGQDNGLPRTASVTRAPGTYVIAEDAYRQPIRTRNMRLTLGPGNMHTYAATYARKPFSMQSNQYCNLINFCLRGYSDSAHSFRTRLRPQTPFLSRTEILMSARERPHIRREQPRNV